MKSMKDLLGDTAPAWDRYPHTPGYKGPSTSKLAADRVKPTTAAMRQAVLADLKRLPQTGSEVSASLGIKLGTIRPRISELHELGDIRPRKENGKAVRRNNAEGSAETVWEIAA